MNPTLKRVLTGLLIGGAVIAATLTAPVPVIAGVCAFLLLLALVELARLVRPKRATEPVRATAAFLFFAVFLTLLFTTLPFLAVTHGNVALLFVIAVIKFSDVGGFAVGSATAKLMAGGNHKMCPAISPGKSWEGLVGSVVFASLAALAFRPCASAPRLFAAFGAGAAVIYGVVAAFIGTAGDLVESKLKRWIGVKDSSTMKLTNGLGGLLDMFDSLLFAPAVLAALL